MYLPYVSLWDFWYDGRWWIVQEWTQGYVDMLQVHKVVEEIAQVFLSDPYHLINYLWCDNDLGVTTEASLSHIHWLLACLISSNLGAIDRYRWLEFTPFQQYCLCSLIFNIHGTIAVLNFWTRVFFDMMSDLRSQYNSVWKPWFMRAECYCFYLNWTIIDVTNCMSNGCHAQSHRRSTYNPHDQLVAREVQLNRLHLDVSGVPICVSSTFALRSMVLHVHVLLIFRQSFTTFRLP